MKTAFKLFLQKSYKAVTLRNIIAESGFSNGTFYHYFSTKEQLYQEVADYYWNELINPPFNSADDRTLHQCIQEALKRTRDIFSAIGTEINLNDEKADFYSFVSEANRLIPGFRDKTLKSHQKGLTVWTTVIENAKHTGEIKSELKSEEIAQLFFTLSYGNTITNFINQEAGLSQAIAPMLKKIQLQWRQLYDLLKQR